MMPFLTTGEAASRAGCSRQALWHAAQTGLLLPLPLYVSERRRLWDGAQIEAYREYLACTRALMARAEKAALI